MNHSEFHSRHQNPIALTPLSKHTSFEIGSHKSIPATEQHRNKLVRTIGRQANKTAVHEDHPTVPREQKRIAHNCQPTPTPYRKQRRPSEAMSTLKTELATLKEEIGKLMTLDGKLREDEGRGQSFGNYSSRNSRRLERDRETASMTHSVLYQATHNDLSFLMKDEDAPSSEKLRYILLENESLKLELKNLKIRYVQRKAELKDEIHCLQLKVNSLESMIGSLNDLNESRRSNLSGDKHNQGLVESLRVEISRLKAKEASHTTQVASKDLEKRLTQKQISLDLFKEQIAQLQKTLQEKDNRIRELEASVQSSNNRHNEHVKLSEHHYKRQLQNAIRAKDQEAAALQRECQQYAQLLEKRDQQLRDLQSIQARNETDAMRKELQDKDLQLSHLDYEKRLLEENTKQHTHQMEKLVESLEQEVYVSEAKLKESCRIISNQQQEIDSFISHRSDSHAVENALQAEVERLQALLYSKDDEIKETVEKGREEATVLNSICEKLSARIGQLEQSLETIAHAKATTEAESSKLNDTVRKLTTQLDQFSRSSHEKSERVAEALSLNNKHYEGKLLQLQQEHEQQIQQLSHSNKEASKVIDQLSTKLRKREEQVAELKQDLDNARKLTEEITISSRKASSNYQELEQQIDSKEEENQKLRGMLNGSRMQLDSLQQDNEKLREELYRLGSLSDRNQQQSATLRQQEAVISQWQAKYQRLEAELDTSNRLAQGQATTLKQLENAVRQKERILQRKDEELASLSLVCSQRANELNDERERWKRADRSSDQSKLISALEGKLKQQASDYDEIIGSLKHELQHLHREELSRSRSTVTDVSLDEAIKGRDDQLKILQENLRQRNLDVERLQSSLAKTKSQLDNLKRQLGVDRVRSISERNSSQTLTDIEMSKLRSDLNLQRKTNESAVQKLKYLNEESRKKDSFIQNYLIGKKLSPGEQVNLQEFFASYEREFPRDTIHSRLFQEVKEIQRLAEHNKLLEGELQRNGIQPPSASQQ